MARSTTHKWAFKPGMRAGAFGWRGTAKATARLKAATREIKAVQKADPVAAGEGVIALAERIWPAFEHIHTSSGALGTAVARSLEDLAPILIDAPADESTRAAWAERLRRAILDDGVDYLAPLADRFGEIAQVPAVINDHADRDLDLITVAWADHDRFSHVPTGVLTLSCMLEAGRHDELLALVDSAKARLWFYEKFADEALLRQGREAEALTRAAALLEGERLPPGYRAIAQFCETLLIRQGRADDAYARYGLPMTSGSTWLVMWRDLVKRYPDRDPRRVLEDLMAHHGRKGKWFAAAKTAGYLDIDTGRPGLRAEGPRLRGRRGAACHRTFARRPRLRRLPPRHQRCGRPPHDSHPTDRPHGLGAGPVAQDRRRPKRRRSDGQAIAGADREAGGRGRRRRNFVNSTGHELPSID